MSDFGKKMGDLYRDVKTDIDRKTIDRQLKEQVQSDMDGLIEKHENPKAEKTSPLSGGFW